MTDSNSNASGSDNSGLVAQALLLTDPDLAGSLTGANNYKSELLEQGARVALFRAYEKGDHRAVVTTQMKNMLRLPEDNSGISDFNDNYCKIVVDKMASRLHISEINIPDGEEEAVKTWLTDLLERNDFEALQGNIWRGAIRDGDTYVMVDPSTLNWSVEPAYDGFSGVVAIFDGTSKTPIWACKLWSEATQGAGLSPAEVISTQMKMVVYQPNRISYWVGEAYSDTIAPDMMVAVEGSPAVSDRDEQFVNELVWPLGSTPIVHFYNQEDPTTFHGESELRPAIPLQDVLNRTLHSMTMASEFSGFRVKWSIGMEINANGITPGAVVNLVLTDSAGKIITEMTPEMAEFLKAVRVGEFEATDIGQYINQIDKIVREISQTTQTPIYGITVEGALSGEALKQLEIGLIGKCERFQRQNADSVRALIQLTKDLQNSFQTDEGGSAPEFEKVALSWKPVEILDTDKQITTLVKMRTDAPGLWPDTFYRKKVGALLGLTQSEVKEAEDQAVEEGNRNLQNLVGAGTGGPTIV